jgi:predicted polyphosphate/ATP-dependent NAD kinase
MDRSGSTKKWRVGFIVNPDAGIGGRVGLKGSDGRDTVRKALELGAARVSPDRASETLRGLARAKDRIELITYPGEMGEGEARRCGFDPIVIGSIVPGQTTAADTREAARMMAEAKVDLLMFAGGDGTARDIFEAVGDKIPVVGIPAGVKIHSSVFAINPRRAAELATEFLRGRARVQKMEVMDIDEDRFREGRVSARLYGYLSVPYERELVQGAKAGTSGSNESAKGAIAQYIADRMMDGYYYILGPGTTVHAIGEVLGIDKTLLGVDLVHQGDLVGKDLGEAQILELIAGKKARIVVTVIGGQGYIFGRGNQQISPRVIKEVGKENLIVVATQRKLLSLEGPLLVDTGDQELDSSLTGYVRVITGYNEESVWKVEC